MTIKTFQVGYMPTNCYIITDDNQEEAVIIDAGGGYEKIMNYLNENNKKPAAVLLTHGHFDHISAVNKFQQKGAKIYIHKLDAELLSEKRGLGSNFGLNIEKINADYTFEDEEIIKVGVLEFKVLHTPGHSKGSSCFVIDNNIFSGDTLFFQSYGRTDFWGGSFADMKASLDKLFNLKGDYKVFPGHMEETSLNYERKNNPIK